MIRVQINKKIAFLENSCKNIEFEFFFESQKYDETFYRRKKCEISIKSFPRKSFSNKFLSWNLRTLNWKTSFEKQMGNLPFLAWSFFISLEKCFHCRRSCKQEETRSRSEIFQCKLLALPLLREAQLSLELKKYISTFTTDIFKSEMLRP